MPQRPAGNWNRQNLICSQKTLVAIRNPVNWLTLLPYYHYAPTSYRKLEQKKPYSCQQTL